MNARLRPGKASRAQQKKRIYLFLSLVFLVGRSDATLRRTVVAVKCLVKCTERVARPKLFIFILLAGAGSDRQMMRARWPLIRGAVVTFYDKIAASDQASDAEGL